MALTVVAQKKWSYTLYQDEQHVFILSVLCGGVGMYELNIPLSDDDAQRALNESAFLEGLAESIRTHPEEYSGRSVTLKR